MSIGSIFYALQPSTSGSIVCHLRAWFSGSSVIGVLAALLTKTNRIRRIFNTKQVSESRISNKDLAITVFLMVLFELVLLVTFSSFPVLSSSLQSIISGEVVTVCPSASADNQSAVVWIAIQFAYVAFFLFGGLIIAFQVRKVPSAFNESSHIAHCLEALLTFGFVIVLVQFITENSPPSLVVLRGLGQAFISLILTLAIFGPKLYFILDGRQNDKAMIYTKSMLGGEKTHIQANSAGHSPERGVLSHSNNNKVILAASGSSSSSSPISQIPRPSSSSSSSSPSSSSSSSSPDECSALSSPRSLESNVWKRLDQADAQNRMLRNALKIVITNNPNVLTQNSTLFQQLSQLLAHPDWLKSSSSSPPPSSSSSSSTSSASSVPSPCSTVPTLPVNVVSVVNSDDNDNLFLPKHFKFESFSIAKNE